jgi:hypothetical protein
VHDAEFVEKLTWGKKVVGVRISLDRAKPSVVNKLVLEAWLHRAPISIHNQARK